MSKRAFGKTIYITLLAFFLSTSGVFANQKETKTLTFVSEAWESATESDGTGLYFDIMRKVFEPLGYHVDTVLTTYSRSVYLVQSGRMDAFMGSYIDEQENVLYPFWHFDAEEIAAVYKASAIPKWEGEKSLKARAVGWIKGYDYDDYIQTEMVIHEIKSRKQGLAMVMSDRLDVLLDARSELEVELSLEDAKGKSLELSTLTELKLYPGFANNERGKMLREIYDKRFEQLLESGELKTLFEQYGWDFFPFDIGSKTQ